MHGYFKWYDLKCYFFSLQKLYIKYCFFFTEVSEKLKVFVNEHNQAFYNTRDNQLIEDARSGALDTDPLIKAMEQRFREETQECAEYRTSPEEERFSQRFHR